MGEERKVPQKKKENTVRHIVFFAISMGVVLVIFLALYYRMRINLSQRYSVEEDKNLVKYVEKASVEDEKLVIEGWCFYRGAESFKQKTQIFLRNINDEEDTIWLDVEKTERKDVDAYYNCEFDYSQTGFVASTDVIRVDPKDDYEIFVKLTLTWDVINVVEGREEVGEATFEKTVSTNRYFSNAGLKALKPGESEPTKVASQWLSEVFDKGHLLGYRADADIYIYQYDRKIYWIAGNDCYFEEDGTTIIEYQMDTTRIDLLPEHRLAKDLHWDTRSFVFEEAELILEDTVPYRVAVKELPSEYPIMYFWSGYLLDETTWAWLDYQNIDIRELCQ